MSANGWWPRFHEWISRFSHDAGGNTDLSAFRPKLRLDAEVSLDQLDLRGEYLKKIGNALKGPIKGFGVLTEYASQWVLGKVSTERIRDVHPSLTTPKV